MSRLLGVALVQRDAFPGDADKNVTDIEQTLDVIAAEYPWVKLVLFPELAVQGFTPDFEDYAEKIPGSSTERIAKKAKEIKKWVIPGSMLELDDGKIYNTSPVFSPDGELVTTYRKMFPFTPLEPCVPGDECKIFEIPGIGKIGLSICYDLWFPELCRTLVSMGAEVILHPSFTPSTLNSREVLCRSSMAMLNASYVLGASTCGLSCGIHSAGHSAIAEPDGTVMQEAGDTPSILVDVLDLDLVKAIREVGTKGIGPYLKHLNFYGHRWPVYGNQKASSPYIDGFDSPFNLVEDLNDLKEV